MQAEGNEPLAEETQKLMTKMRQSDRGDLSGRAHLDAASQGA